MAKDQGSTPRGTQPRSFRLPRTTLSQLDRRAAHGGESANALAQRYIEEGLRMDEHPLIAFRSGAAGRRPAVAGTRLDVWQVVETVRANDGDVRAAAEYLGIGEHRVRAAVRYYAAYQEEVDAWAARMREFAEREEEVWRREQEVLA